MKQKLDKTHLDSIKDIQSKFADNSNSIGNITIEREYLKEQLVNLEHESENYFNVFKQLKQEEEKLFADLKQRYGEGQINIQEGTFDPL